MSAKGVEGEEEKRERPAKPRRPRSNDEASTAADEKTGGSPSRPGGDQPEMGQSLPRGGRRSAEAKSNEDVGGWMNTPSKKKNGEPGKSRIQLEPEGYEEDAENKDISNRKQSSHFNDDDDGIMLIPDLDDDGEGADGEGDNRVAQAPRNVHRKIPTLEELENDMRSSVPCSSEDGIDLGILTRTLVPPSQLQEGDSTWDFDGLLREVTDELTSTPKTVVSATISSTVVNAKERADKEEKSSKKGKKRST
jgi:hypothetical protein